MKIDLNIGDTILGGKFKNKKYIIAGFGKDENNQPTIKTKSGKEIKLLTFRIEKIMKENKELSIKKLYENSLNESSGITFKVTFNLI